MVVISESQEEKHYSSLLKVLALRSDLPFDLSKMRKDLEDFGRLFQDTEGVKVTPCTLAGCPVEILDPEKDSSGGVLLYLHGGGFVMGSIASHRQLAARIAVAAQTKTIILDYRLAPEHPFPAALIDCEAVYHSILEQGFLPGQIGVCGDSAGGGLCVSLLVRLKKANIPLPNACVCLSPWVDLSQQGNSWEANAEHDLLVDKKSSAQMTQYYLKDQSRYFHEASPVYADLSGLPEMLIHVSSTEVLLDDARLLHRRAKECGVSVNLKIWSDLPHVWQFMAASLKQGKDAINDIGLFINSLLSNN